MEYQLSNGAARSLHAECGVSLPPRKDTSAGSVLGQRLNKSTAHLPSNGSLTRP
jgi:hypothetical protein